MWFDTTNIGQNSLTQIIIAVVMFLVLCVIIAVLKRVILKRASAWAKNTKNKFDDALVVVLRKVGVPLLYYGAFYLSIKNLVLPQGINKIIDILGVGLLVFGVAYVATILVGFFFTVYWAKQGKDVAVERSLKGVLTVLKTLIWLGCVVFFLDNIGFKITSVIAGLGIGGVAVALAAQAILGDLFSYMAIIFDRPFEVGDFIIVNDYLGTVEYIGIKTTRLRSLGGEQIVFSNTDLTNSRVRNYKRMNERRVVFKIGVTYDTPTEKLEKIPNTLKEIIQKIPMTRFDRAHFASYGDFSIVFEVVYYVLNPDYNVYMDTQQAINLEIKRQFEAMEVEFAFPTQTVYVKQEAA